MTERINHCPRTGVKPCLLSMCSEQPPKLLQVWHTRTAPTTEMSLIWINTSSYKIHISSGWAAGSAQPPSDHPPPPRWASTIHRSHLHRSDFRKPSGALGRTDQTTFRQPFNSSHHCCYSSGIPPSWLYEVEQTEGQTQMWIFHNCVLVVGFREWAAKKLGCWDFTAGRQSSLPRRPAPGWPWSVTGLSHSRAECQQAGERWASAVLPLHAAEQPSSETHQSVEGGNWQDAQPAQGQLGGAAGSSKEALGVRQLPALQAGQIAAHPEQIHVKFLQVLLPLLDLFKQE